MKAFAEMLVSLAPFLLWVATVAASQVSIHADLDEDDDDKDVHDKHDDVQGKDDDVQGKDGDDNDVQRMMLMMQGLTAKQWSEKGTVGHFGGVVLSPSYRHVRLYLYLYLYLYKN